MNYLIGIIVALLGGFLYQRNKAAIAEAINKNVDEKEKLNTIDRKIAENSGIISAEEQKQTELKEEIQNADNTKVDLATVVNLINDLTKKK